MAEDYHRSTNPPDPALPAPRAAREGLADQALELYNRLCILSYDASLPGDYGHRVNEAAHRANRRLFRRLVAPTKPGAS